MKLSYDGFGINDANDTFKSRVLTFTKNPTISPDVLGPQIAALPELIEVLQTTVSSLQYAVDVLQPPTNSYIRENLAAAKAALEKAGVK